ncbi:hypothetical protein JW962_03675 [Candidatus Dojkabacteria bacterium]|nr:hypothetical protein [Candidatus Dojkabacteria bacterium]
MSTQVIESTKKKKTKTILIIFTVLTVITAGAGGYLLWKLNVGSDTGRADWSCDCWTECVNWGGVGDGNNCIDDNEEGCKGSDWVRWQRGCSGGTAGTCWSTEDSATVVSANDPRCTATPPAAHCSNGIQDQDETGVDCGGAHCNVCGAADHCSNGVLDGDETGVDCGGSCSACTSTGQGTACLGGGNASNGWGCDQPDTIRCTYPEATYCCSSSISQCNGASGCICVNWQTQSTWPGGCSSLSNTGPYADGCTLPTCPVGYDDCGITGDSTSKTGCSVFGNGCKTLCGTCNNPSWVYKWCKRGGTITETPYCAGITPTSVSGLPAGTAARSYTLTGGNGNITRVEYTVNCGNSSTTLSVGGQTTAQGVRRYFDGNPAVNVTMTLASGVQSDTCTVYGRTEISGSFYGADICNSTLSASRTQVLTDGVCVSVLPNDTIVLTNSTGTLRNFTVTAGGTAAVQQYIWRVDQNCDGTISASEIHTYNSTATTDNRGFVFTPPAGADDGDLCSVRVDIRFAGIADPVTSTACQVNATLRAPGEMAVEKTGPICVERVPPNNVAAFTVTGNVQTTEVITRITDILPPGFTYQANSARIRIGSGTATAVEPTITTQNGVTTLVWTGNWTITPVSGADVTITFTALATTAAVTGQNVNEITIEIEDGNPGYDEYAFPVEQTCSPDTGILDMPIAIIIPLTLLGIAIVLYKGEWFVKLPKLKFTGVGDSSESLLVLKYTKPKKHFEESVVRKVKNK